ncbi:MAG: FKBP-type peptidyl-prolyl cis-trans isomerase FklB [Arcticibacterium sp.]|jgi:FKBP-type peptidyl-prolyl cis-trans isomerase FklB
MKKTISAFFTLFLATQSLTALSQSILSNESDSLSYAIGVNIGQSLKAQNLTTNTEVLYAAIKDVLNSSEMAIPPAECGAYIQSYMQKAASEISDANLDNGNAFLEKNKLREGVMVTASGLQYEVLNAAEGAKPIASQKVKVHYHGTLIDGTVFDSSVERGNPSTFGVTQVIKGWVEGLQLMPLGSKYKFFIPSSLAYGVRGQGKIAPNSALIFEVELLEIL